MKIPPHTNDNLQPLDFAVNEIRKRREKCKAFKNVKQERTGTITELTTEFMLTLRCSAIYAHLKNQ